MTFKQIQDDALERLNNNSNEARIRIRRFINEWNRRLCVEAGLGMLRDAETTLSTVAGTDEYALAAGVAKIRGIQDETNGNALAEVSLEWMRQVDPEDDMTGDPLYYAMRSARKIKVKPVPSANGTLTLDYEATISDMDDDADAPQVPEEFHYLLVLGARINEYEKNDDGRLRAAQAEMASGIARLKHWVAVRPRTVVSNSSSVRHSRLGSWYPAE